MDAFRDAVSRDEDVIPCVSMSHMRITDMQSTPIRAVIYARLSQAKVKGEESDSIANQVKAARLLAQRTGYELMGEFKDDDISGYKGGRRPAFGRMLAGMANGDFDLILVRHVWIQSPHWYCCGANRYQSYIEPLQMIAIAIQ